MKDTTEDKRYKARLFYYEGKKGLPHAEAVRLAKGGSKESGNGAEASQPSKWAQRQAAKKSQEVRPLKLCGCPECGVEFGIRKDGQYQDIKLDKCPVCERRFYVAGGPV